MGVKHNLTTSFHPNSNGKIERLNESLKNSLRAKLDGKQTWLAELDLVMLGLRNSPNMDTSVSPAVLVFGQTLDVPGQMVLPREEPPKNMFAQQLARSMQRQQFTNSFWHGGEKRQTFVPVLLKDCSHVLVRRDAIQPTLAPKFNGPFQMLDRGDKFFKMQLWHKADNVSIDRLVPFMI